MEMLADQIVRRRCRRYPSSPSCQPYALANVAPVCLVLVVAVDDVTFLDFAGKEEMVSLELSLDLAASSSLCVAKSDTFFGSSFIFSSR